MYLHQTQLKRSTTIVKSLRGYNLTITYCTMFWNPTEVTSMPLMSGTPELGRGFVVPRPPGWHKHTQRVRCICPPTRKRTVFLSEKTEPTPVLRFYLLVFGVRYNNLLQESGRGSVETLRET